MENNIKNSYRLKTQQISAKMNWFSLDYIFNDILDVSEGNSRKKRQNYNNVATKYKSCANIKKIVLNTTQTYFQALNLFCI